MENVFLGFFFSDTKECNYLLLEVIFVTLDCSLQLHKILISVHLQDFLLYSSSWPEIGQWVLKVVKV